MAGLTRASFGVGLTITLLSVLTLGFFVAFVIFFGKANNASRAQQDADRQNAEIVQAAERNSEAVRLMMAESKTSGKSLVGYLMKRQTELREVQRNATEATQAYFRDPQAPVLQS